MEAFAMRNSHSSPIYSQPNWVVSRYYDTNNTIARALITNSRTWTHLELEGDSADIWNVLPQEFTEHSLLHLLADNGYATGNSNFRLEIREFLTLLCEQSCLLRDNDILPDRMDATNTTIRPPWLPSNSHDVEKDFSDWLVSCGYLPHAMFELTYRCNQRCLHCFNPKESANRKDELSTQEVVSALDDLTRLGVYSVTFTGGEVSLRDDLIDILQEAKDRNFAFTIFTNGLQPSKWLDTVIRLWPQSIGVSIYSADPTTHDAITQIQGSHARSIETVRKLRNHGIRTTVKCPIMRQNATCIDGVLELCRTFHVTPEIDLQIAPSTNGDCTVSKSCGIVDAQHMAALLGNRWTAMHVGPDVPNIGRARRPMDAPVCGAGEYAISIAPDGTVYPCNSLPLKLGNIRDNSLTDIVTDSKVLSAWRGATLADYDECGAYARCSFCNHCPGIALSETNDPLKASPICCHNAAIRMAVSRAIQAGRDPVKDLDAFLEQEKGSSKFSELDPRHAETAERVVRIIEKKQSDRQPSPVDPEIGSPRNEWLSLEAHERASSRGKEWGR